MAKPRIKLLVPPDPADMDDEEFTIALGVRGRRAMLLLQLDLYGQGYGAGKLWPMRYCRRKALRRMRKRVALNGWKQFPRCPAGPE